MEHEVLVNQLLANANDPSWYVPFTEAVQGLTQEEAEWKISEDTNSIAELVQHLLYWNETWQIRYKKCDIHAVPPVGSNDSTFTVVQDKPFDTLQKQLLAVLLHWQGILTQEQLATDVPGIPGSKWWEVVGNVTTHNAYHIGQIVLIRKVQKSWVN